MIRQWLSVGDPAVSVGHHVQLHFAAATRTMERWFGRELLSCRSVRLDSKPCSASVVCSTFLADQKTFQVNQNKYPEQASLSFNWQRLTIQTRRDSGSREPCLELERRRRSELKWIILRRGPVILGVSRLKPIANIILTTFVGS